MRALTRNGIVGAMALAMTIAIPSQVQADTGRLLVTGGATTVEGVAGGGVVPLALISGLGAKGEVGATAFATHVNLSDYDLAAAGVAINIDNRIELSFAQFDLDISESFTGRTVLAAGVTGNKHTKVDVFGAKFRIAGDAVYEPDSWMPQVAVGVQYKRNRDDKLMDFLNADKSSVEAYVAATKVFLAGPAGRNAFVNGVARLTKSNYLGIFGFGNTQADGDNDHSLEYEFSAGILLTKDILLGAELKTVHDSNTLSGAVDYEVMKDVFVGYFPTKNISMVAAYADLGQIGLDQDEDQKGLYLSLQLTY